MANKNLEPRVERLEQDMAVARQDAAVARVLASAADRDVSELRSELRAHTRVMNALRETQLEHGLRLDALGGRVDALDRKVTDGFSTMNVGMAQIVALLQPEAR